MRIYIGLGKRTDNRIKSFWLGFQGTRVEKKNHIAVKENTNYLAFQNRILQNGHTPRASRQQPFQLARKITKNPTHRSRPAPAQKSPLHPSLHHRHRQRDLASGRLPDPPLPNKFENTNHPLNLHPHLRRRFPLLAHHAHDPTVSKIIHLSTPRRHQSLGAGLFRLEFRWRVHCAFDRHLHRYLVESCERANRRVTTLNIIGASLHTDGRIDAVADAAGEDTVSDFFARERGVGETGVLYHC